MEDGSITTAYSDPGEGQLAPANMVKGPEGTIIVSNRLLERREVHLFDTSSTVFTLQETLETSVAPRTICYHNTGSMGDLVVTSDPFLGKISATGLQNKQLEWRLEGEVQGKIVQANQMRSGPNGQLFIADGINQRIITLDGSTGLILQVLELPQLGGIYGVEYSIFQYTTKYYCIAQKGTKQSIPN